jgi:branched-chain amino acid transport system permease protein
LAAAARCAALAGVIGGNAFVTEPGMAAAVGSIIFVVVVVGGLGSLAGAFITSLLIGMMQTFAVALDVSLASLGLQVPSGSALAPLARLTLAQVAPVLPYLLLVVMLVVRPKGLMGRREG